LCASVEQIWLTTEVCKNCNLILLVTYSISQLLKSLFFWSVVLTHLTSVKMMQ